MTSQRTHIDGNEHIARIEAIMDSEAVAITCLTGLLWFQIMWVVIIYVCITWTHTKLNVHGWTKASYYFIYISVYIIETFQVFGIGNFCTY